MDKYSIVDYLKSQERASDFDSRKILAQRLGINDYTGTAEPNTEMLRLLRDAPFAGIWGRLKSLLR